MWHFILGRDRTQFFSVLHGKEKMCEAKTLQLIHPHHQ
jgi:hypothetical protein